MQLRRLWALLFSLLLSGSIAACTPFRAGGPLLDTPPAGTARPEASRPQAATGEEWEPAPTFSPQPGPSYPKTPLAETSAPVAAVAQAEAATPEVKATPAVASPPAVKATPTEAATPEVPHASVPLRGEPVPISLRWRFDSGGHLTDQAVISLGGQSVYLVASLDRTVSALSSAGKVLWRAKVAGPAYALAVVDEDRVAVGDDAGYVTLLDAHGKRLWRHDLGSRVTALRGWQGDLLAGGWDERLTLFYIASRAAGDSAGGEPKVRWQADTGGPVSGIAVLPDYVLAATLYGQVRAFDRVGREVWRFDAGAPITGLGTMSLGSRVTGEAAAGMLILVGTQDGRLRALDAKSFAGAQDEGTGIRPKWEHLLGQGGPAWHAADLVGDPTPEIVVGTGGTAPSLRLLTAQGDVLWHIIPPAAVGAIAAVDLDGNGSQEILAGLISGEIQAFDGQGRLRASIHAGLPVGGLEATADGSALVRADVVAWQARGVDGPVGSPWLAPPAMVQTALVGSYGGPPLLAGETGGPAPTTKQGGADLVFLGDVALGRSMEEQLLRYGPVYPWEGLEPLLQKADLAVANLECVLTTQGRPLAKQYVIRAHPRWGEALVRAGIDLVTVANNHALDYGQAGLDETLATLQDLGIDSIGAGSSGDKEPWPDGQDGQPHRPALFNLRGIRVAVLGYAAARWNGSADVPATDRLAWAEPDTVQADVRAARDQSDVVVVLLHSGTEYAASPSSAQVTVAHAAVDAGADLVVGHHPHVTQTVERYRHGLIVYSLGDALFDIPRPAAMQGHLLHVHVTQEGITSAALWPFWIEDAIRPRLLDDGQGAPQVKVIYP